MSTSAAAGPVVSSFPGAVRAAAELATCPAVADRWEQESAWAGTTVGGLARHLVDQAGNTVRLLGAPPRTDPPIALLEHDRALSRPQRAPSSVSAF